MDEGVKEVLRARRSDCLPPKFGVRERRAYDWLYDCQVRGWLVDMVDKSVYVEGGRRFRGLVSYAKHCGMG